MTHGGSPFTGNDSNLLKIIPLATNDITKDVPYWMMANDVRWSKLTDPKVPLVEDAKDPRNGKPAVLEYCKNTNYVAMYWTGMEPNRNWIRVDAIRKFAGIPT
jgi:hypothetical protein